MTIRAFVAANLSVSVTRRIADEVERRRKVLSEAQIAWVPPANYHLTLQFLGAIPAESVEGVASALRKMERSPVDLRVVGLGGFPAAEPAPAIWHPTVLWVGVDGGEALKRLQHNVESALSGIGFVRPESEKARPFHPHVTVARVKAESAVDFGTTWSGATELGLSTINEIVVYESKTLRAGAEYTARARVKI